MARLRAPPPPFDHKDPCMQNPHTLRAHVLGASASLGSVAVSTPTERQYLARDTPFPPATFSKAWFDRCFVGYDSEAHREYYQAVPTALRACVERICIRFAIRGICDPMYVANVVAFELGWGDGQGTFTPEAFNAQLGQAKRAELDETLMRLATRLSSAYSTCVSNSTGCLVRGKQQMLDELLALARGTC